ncbi:MAG: hypothetical protein EA411_04805 [Saprospirales bacterium]|nr:MAG: hypothetical protein EA411_04805 [Saprospirales bacterium]
MGFFSKIKKIFGGGDNKDRPLPGDEEFDQKDKSFDPERILKEMEEEIKQSRENTSGKAPPHSESKSSKQIQSDDLTDLFVSEEDKIDTDRIRKSSLEDRQEEASKEQSEHLSSKKAQSQSESSSQKERLYESIEELKNRASAAGSKVKKGMDEFLDDVQKKSDELDRIEEEEAKKYSGPLKFRDKSLLDDKDDFFKKASAFADGRPMPDEKPEAIKKKSDDKKSEDTRKVYGFEDLDGDGDEIIDDAIIEEE